MKQRYLEVTFRKGRPLAAYLYLPRGPGARAASTIDGGHGVRVDLDDLGAPIGLEITTPSAITLADLNSVLARFGVGAIDDEEWSPLAA